jgi:hypothetical protein
MRSYVLLALATACASSDAGARKGPNDSLPPLAVRPTASPAAARPSPPTDSVPLPPIDSVPVRFDAAGRPVVPIVFADTCQGEDCAVTFGAVACVPVALRRAPSDSAPVATRVAEGDTVHVARRDVHVPKVGVLVMRTNYVVDRESMFDPEGNLLTPRPDTVRLARGDTLFLLTYLALGRWSWAYHGTIHESDVFWAEPPRSRNRDSTRAVARSLPTDEDWWYVQSRHHTAGWWRGDGHAELRPVEHMTDEPEDCEEVKERMPL